MFQNFRAFALLAAVLLVGCDRVQTLTAKLKTSVGDKQAATAAIATGSPAPVFAPVSDLDAANYAAFTAQTGKLVIVDFHADWCGPCKMMGPALEKAVAAHPGAVVLGKVNVDKAKSLAADNQVGSIPDVRIFKDGRKVDGFIGFPGEAVLAERIAALAKDITPSAAPAAAPANSGPKIAPMPKNWLPPGLEKR